MDLEIIIFFIGLDRWDTIEIRQWDITGQKKWEKQRNTDVKREC
jgi:hypothetical protein